MAAELQPARSPVSNHPVQPTLPAAPTTVAPKRHRRPSVRLGDIGDQPATLRTAKPWRINPNPYKSSRTRPLTNLATGYFNPNTVISADTTTPITSNNNNGNSHRKDFKSWRTTTGAKRVRTTNFTIDEPQPEAREERENGDNKDNAAVDNDDEEGFRYFDSEGSEQEEEEPQSPLHSADVWHGHNRSSFRGVSDSHPEFPKSDFRSRGATGDIGLRTWLVGLGLGRYAPVFEIHEVDDEVLPHLTLQDLKDMGINAVGSRRKLYSAIQKLPKGFS